MKRIIALVLAFVTVCILAIPVAAETLTTVTPRYTYTHSVYAYLDIDALGVAHCRGDCIADDAVNVKVRVYLEYYSESTESWGTVKVWQAENIGVAAIDAYYAVYSGFQYRVRTVGYVYNSSGAIVEIVSAVDTFYY